jgi:formylglycine-generating enzyme required for sulfatase activity
MRKQAESIGLLAVVLASASACAKAPPVTTVPSTSSEMVRIPAATYVTGTDSSEIPELLARYGTNHTEIFAGEIPRRVVQVNAFWIDRRAITKMQFRGFLRSIPQWRKGAQRAGSNNGRYLEDWTLEEFRPSEAQRPVVFVTWPAAAAYCAWAGKRLPTEAEWEFAARGGLVNAEFPWGNTMPDSSSANWAGTKLGRTSDVGQFPANGYGLFDMAGNVWEFVADRWDKSDTRPETPATRHVIKGGSFEGAAVNMRVRYRDSHPSGGAGPHVGFRCARSLPNNNE